MEKEWGREREREVSFFSFAAASALQEFEKVERALFTSSFLFPFLADDEEEELLLLLSPPPKPLPEEEEAETRRSGQRRGALGRRRSIEIDGGDGGIGAANVAVADERRALVGQAAAIDKVCRVVSFQSESFGLMRENTRARERRGKEFD